MSTVATGTPEPEPQRETKPASDLMKGPVTVKMGPKGVEITDIDGCFRFASVVHNSGLAPKGLASPQAIMIAIQMGAELGMKPMTAIQNIAVINGRPSIWGDAMLAVCMKSNFFDHESFRERIEEIDGVPTAFCTARRIGSPAITQDFSMDDAKKAGLLEKNTPWQTYEKRMLKFRARSWALRDCFPDVLLGLRGAEEQMDCIDHSAAEAPETLDDLTEKLQGPPPPPLPGPPPPPLPADKTEAAEPAPNPPTPDEVASDQTELTEDFSREIAKATTLGRLADLSAAIGKAMASDAITVRQANELRELVKAAKGRFSKT